MTGSGPSSTAVSGGTADGLQPAHVPQQQVVILARQARPPQRLDQRRHGVRARLAQPADGVILLRGSLRQVGDRTARSGRAGSRTAATAAARASLSGWANGRVAGIVIQPQERARPVPVPDRDQRRVIGLALLELVQVRHRLRGLAGADQVVGGVPELDRASAAPGRTAPGPALGRLEGFFAAGRCQPPRRRRSPAGRTAASPGSRRAAGSIANPNRFRIAINVASSSRVFRNWLEVRHRPSRTGRCGSRMSIGRPEARSAGLVAPGKSTGPGGYRLGGRTRRLPDRIVGGCPDERRLPAGPAAQSSRAGPGRFAGPSADGAVSRRRPRSRSARSRPCGQPSRDDPRVCVPDRSRMNCYLCNESRSGFPAPIAVQSCRVWKARPTSKSHNSTSCRTRSSTVSRRRTSRAFGPSTRTSAARGRVL